MEILGGIKMEFLDLFLLAIFLGLTFGRKYWIKWDVGYYKRLYSLDLDADDQKHFSVTHCWISLLVLLLLVFHLASNQVRFKMPDWLDGFFPVLFIIVFTVGILLTTKGRLRFMARFVDKVIGLEPNQCRGKAIVVFLSFSWILGVIAIFYVLLSNL